MAPDPNGENSMGGKAMWYPHSHPVSSEKAPPPAHRAGRVWPEGLGQREPASTPRHGGCVCDSCALRELGVWARPQPGSRQHGAEREPCGPALGGRLDPQNSGCTRRPLTGACVLHSCPFSKAMVGSLQCLFLLLQPRSHCLLKG